MSRQVNDTTLIPSEEVIADDIVLADESQIINPDDQCALVTAEAISDNHNKKQKDGTNSDEYKPPKFDDIKEFLAAEDGLDIYQLVAFRIASGNGCCAHRKKQHIDENKQPPKCRNDHDLKYHEAIHDKFTCDGCDKSMEEYAELWGCRECDYDLCRPCYDKVIEENNEEIASCWGYWMDIIKAVICCFTQFSSIFVLYFYTVTMKEDSERTWCDNTETNDISSKLMAISYAFFLSLIFHLKLRSQTSGFYKCINYGERNHNFISSDWLKFGAMINRLLLLNVFYLSFLIIFFSTDPLDIILNCVALFFLLDIDNEVIDSEDYSKTLKWFENEENIKSCKDIKFNKCRRWIYNIEWYVDLVLMCTTYIGIVVVPFVVAVCY